MKSSDFERLGDWQRKQQWGFKDALNNVVNQCFRKNNNCSSCISTDKGSLQRKKKIYETNIKEVNKHDEIDSRG